MFFCVFLHNPWSNLVTHGRLWATKYLSALHKSDYHTCILKACWCLWKWYWIFLKRDFHQTDLLLQCMGHGVLFRKAWYNLLENSFRKDLYLWRDICHLNERTKLELVKETLRHFFLTPTHDLSELRRVEMSDNSKFNP